MPVQVLRFRALRWSAVLLCLAAAGRPQASGEPVVARIFEHAGRLLQEGRPELAIDEYRRLVESYPRSELADDALLAIGIQAYAVEGPDGLGRAHGKALEEAARTFDRVRREHPQGNAAPAAIARLALLRLEPRSAARSVEEARALFASVRDIYPDSEWGDEASLGMAFCARLAGSAERVVADLQPFWEALAASPLAARARLWRADAFEALGQRARALELYQRLREEAPRSTEAAWAQGRAALLLRRTLAAQGSARLVEDPTFQSGRLADLKQAPGVSSSGHGWIYLADGARGRILRLNARGQLLEEKPASPPVSMVIDVYGQAAVLEESAVRVGKQRWAVAVPDGNKMAALRPSAAPMPRQDGSWWLADARGRVVLEFDRELAFRRAVWSDDSFSARRARIGADDTAWLLDPDSGRLVRLGRAGEARSMLLGEAPASLLVPVDLAVDAHGALWVLDSGRRGVAVFSPAGHYEGFVPFEAAGEASLLEALEVDPTGGVLAYDTRQRRLRRFRDPGPPPAGVAHAEVKP